VSVPETTDVVILGAGPSGLAVGACLRARGTPFVMLEQADAVGATWRRHYERLHLHTVARFSALPRMPWPEGTGMYPSRAEVVTYLDAYAKHFDLAPRFGATVTRARREGSRWVVTTSRGGEASEIACRALVVATGYNRVPNEPSLPGRERFTGDVLHSSAYRAGDAWRGKRAVVVGIGNSGGEIALDLWESGASVTLSVRSPVHVVPRDLFGMPAQVNSLFGLGRLPPRIGDAIVMRLLDLVVGDLSPYGLRRPDVGPMRQVIERGRIPLIDIGTVALVKQRKIAVVTGPRAFTERGLELTDGREVPADLVLFATGYRPAIASFLEGAGDALDARGYPRFHGAEVTVPGAEGLWFLGFRNPLTGQLHDIALEAERISAAIAGKASTWAS
jgi:cation diffusion facilitator CzcD-associated flavoprotein CzcO